MNTAEFDTKLKEFLDAGKEDEARAYIDHIRQTIAARGHLHQE